MARASMVLRRFPRPPPCFLDPSSISRSPRILWACAEAMADAIDMLQIARSHGYGINDTETHNKVDNSHSTSRLPHLLVLALAWRSSCSSAC